MSTETYTVKIDALANMVTLSSGFGDVAREQAVAALAQKLGENMKAFGAKYLKSTGNIGNGLIRQQKRLTVVNFRPVGRHKVEVTVKKETNQDARKRQKVSVSRAIKIAQSRGSDKVDKLKSLQRGQGQIIEVTGSNIRIPVEAKPKPPEPEPSPKPKPKPEPSPKPKPKPEPSPKPKPPDDGSDESGGTSPGGSSGLKHDDRDSKQSKSGLVSAPKTTEGQNDQNGKQPDSSSSGQASSNIDRRQLALGALAVGGAMVMLR